MSRPTGSRCNGRRLPLPFSTTSSPSRNRTSLSLLIGSLLQEYPQPMFICTNLSKRRRPATTDCGLTPPTRQPSPSRFFSQRPVLLLSRAVLGGGLVSTELTIATPTLIRTLTRSARVCSTATWAGWFSSRTAQDRPNRHYRSQRGCDRSLAAQELPHMRHHHGACPAHSCLRLRMG